MPRANLLGLVLFLGGSAGYAAAEDASLPISALTILDTHFQTQETKAQGAPLASELFNDSDLSTSLAWSDWLQLNGDLRLERQHNDQLDDYYPSGNAFLRSEGLTAQQLYASVESDDWRFYGGKLETGFASGYRSNYGAQQGIFYGFGWDYDQSERIALGIERKLPQWMGDARISVETFFLDTSFLSNSLFSRPSLADESAERPRQFRLDQYFPSDTGNFNSYTIALKGSAIPDLDGLKYQVSYTREATHVPTWNPERGESAGVAYDPTGSGVPLAAWLGVVPRLEFTHFDNEWGVPGLERNYALAGAAFVDDRWSVDLNFGLRQTHDPANSSNYPFTNAIALQENNAWDVQENATLAYEVIDNLRLAVGFNHIRIDGRPSNSVAQSLDYRILF